jgi:hypothetical protein
VTIISPGFVRTNFAESVTNPDVQAPLAASRDKFAMPPDAVARAIAFAIEQPADVDVNEMVVRPTAGVNVPSLKQGTPGHDAFICSENLNTMVYHTVAAPKCPQSHTRFAGESSKNSREAGGGGLPVFPALFVLTTLHLS